MYVLVLVRDPYYPKSIFVVVVVVVVVVVKCTEGLISTPKIITFLPNPIPGNKKLSCLSNSVPYPAYLFLLISAFLYRLTARNVNVFTYLINNVNVYYFPMIKCNLFQTAFIKFYFCFSTKKT